MASVVDSWVFLRIESPSYDLTRCGSAAAQLVG